MHGILVAKQHLKRDGTSGKEVGIAGCIPSSATGKDDGALRTTLVSPLDERPIRVPRLPLLQMLFSITVSGHYPAVALGRLIGMIVLLHLAATGASLSLRGAAACYINMTVIH